MIRILLSTVALLFLVSCDKTAPIQIQPTKIIVAKVPKTLYTCPKLEEYPDIDTMANEDVIDVIDTLYRFNETCRINMRSIQRLTEKLEMLHENADVAQR